MKTVAWRRNRGGWYGVGKLMHLFWCCLRHHRVTLSRPFGTELFECANCKLGFLRY